MPTIRLPDEAEHGEMVRKIDAMIREISKATAMTPSTRALGLRPSILMGNHQELAYVMATRTLLNLQKRMIALAVAAAKAAPYELYAHTRGLQREYGLADGEIVELVATIAHVTSINTFERAIAAFNDNAPIRTQDSSTPVLVEVRAKLGSVPRYFMYMAGDPIYTKIVLEREIATVHEGEVSRLNKELVAYATSVVNDARLSITYRAENLRQLGMTNEQLFEATTVISVYAKNCAFSTGLQLDPAPA
jgi:alkylhydroperoxidase/carboxymuconolactone decarboxylase family protein YurZ